MTRKPPPQTPPEVEPAPGPEAQWPAAMVQLWPIGRPQPRPGNPRTHSDQQIDQIAASMREWGFTQAILVDEDDVVIAGHGRLLGARRNGYTKVPVVVARGWRPEQIRAYVIADNKLALNAGWDEDLLAVELKALNVAGYDLGLTGFNADELQKFVPNETPPADDEDQDDVPGPWSVPVSLVGDVWTLGRHRLACGDSSASSVVANLMRGRAASLCFTSPPYADQRDYTTGGISDWDGLMRGVCGQIPLEADGQLLVNLGMVHRENEVLPYWDGWLAWMRETGWRRFGWYVWDQGPGIPGDWHGRLAPSFEFVFHFNRQSRKPNKIVPCKMAGEDTHTGATEVQRKRDGEFKGWSHQGRATQDMRIPDSVIRVMRHKGKIGEGIDHPAVFPVALAQFAIEAYSAEGDVVFEPFGGSGTTMIACQRTGRACRSIELAPKYVDVALRRFRQYYPEIPITLEGDERNFDEIVSARTKTQTDVSAGN